MRSLSLANALSEICGRLEIRFILSENAPYTKSCPYPFFLTPDSPTKHTRLVNKFVDEFEPNVVIFDASGRVGQLRHCKLADIKTVFIAQHKRKIYQGLRWRRLRYIDHFWVVQPEFAVSELSMWARCKLKVLNKAYPLQIGPIFTAPRPEFVESTLQRYGLLRSRYIVVNAGSGGHSTRIVANKMKGGQTGDFAADIFALAAQRIIHGAVLEAGIQVVMIYGPNYAGEGIGDSTMIEIDQLKSEEFTALLSASSFAVLAGGSSMLQAISYNIPTVAVAVSGDQQERINACKTQGLILQARLDVEHIVQQLKQLSSTKRHIGSSQGVCVSNGLGAALAQLTTILGLLECE